jgi:hypothetical protein
LQPNVREASLRIEAVADEQIIAGGDLDAARWTKAMGTLLLARNGIDARPGARK